MASVTAVDSAQQPADRDNHVPGLDGVVDAPKLTERAGAVAEDGEDVQRDPPAAATTTERAPRENGSHHPSLSLIGSRSIADELEEEDELSSEVTSPGSVSSPPYWLLAYTKNQNQNGNHGNNNNRHESAAAMRHARTTSNVSVESVLPSGAITLQDNEREDDGPGAGGILGRDRSRACWAKSVEVTDYVMVNGSAASFGAFVVWNIRVQTLSGSYMNIRKRYSEFDEFRRQLTQTFPNFEAAVPALPPKSVLSRFQPRFLEKRRAGLQYFLNCILLNPEFSGSPVLKDFLFS